MNKKITMALPLLVLGTTSAIADSSYQNTCSNTGFIYEGSDAALIGTCLKRDGTPNSTSLIIKGVSNENGILTQGKGSSSSFQQSCGSIQIRDGVLYADCRMKNGQFRSSSLLLPDIKNNDGNLSY